MLIREATPADSFAIARVHVDTWRTTYRGIVSDEVLDGLSYESRRGMWDLALTTQRASNHIFVAESDDGAVAGFVAAGKEREGRGDYSGEIYAIYLLEHYQGRGWGKQLFLAAAHRLMREGFSSMMLWVLADNPTRGFYEALGGRLLEEKEIEIGKDRLIEVAYGWERMEELLVE